MKNSQIAYKIVSVTNDGRLLSFNSVSFGMPFERHKDFYVEYTPFKWASPRVKGTRLFALSKPLETCYAMNCRIKQFKCKVVNPIEIEYQAHLYDETALIDIWKSYWNGDTDGWFRYSFFPNTIITSRLMLLEEVPINLYPEQQ